MCGKSTVDTYFAFFRGKLSNKKSYSALNCFQYYDRLCGGVGCVK